jgi:hypothetical protein
MIREPVRANKDKFNEVAAETRFEPALGRACGAGYEPVESEKSGTKIAYEKGKWLRALLS